MLGMEGRMMRNVAIVAAASRQEEKMLDTEVEILDATGNVLASQPIVDEKNLYEFEFGNVAGTLSG